jgi:hypothetical protein
MLGAAFLLTQSVHAWREPRQRVRLFTRAIEFDFAGWTAQAIGAKLAAAASPAAAYMTESSRSDLVRAYAALIDQAAELQAELLMNLAQPDGATSESTRALEGALDQLRQRMDALQPVVESILQEQVGGVLVDLGLGAGGKTVPPVAFRFSELPLALIVSPRNVIRQDANIQIEAGLEPRQQVALEGKVEQSLDVSALVVPVGGIGVYPTMVMESGALVWLTDVVAHEWAHNYLSTRPLGWLYDASPETRTMNETAASLWGREVGRRVLEKHYPELAPPPEPVENSPAETADQEIPPPQEPPGFDFREQMRLTRLQVDQLLAEGEIERAESYMEDRRQLFVQNGYNLRRLNQAYFAFHGAYADEPGGAAGEDPVGAAVRRLWDLSASPSDFLRRIAWITSYEALQETLAEISTPPSQG